MWIRKINESGKELAIAIPLTKGTDKTRIKKRGFFNEYGLPVSTKTEPFSLDCYVEWQIGYDVVVSDAEKLERTTIKDKVFTGANGKDKTLYELSEYIYYFHKWGVVSKKQLLELKNFLAKLGESDFIDDPNNFAIERSQPVERKVLDIVFAYTQVKYPMLIHRFGDYEILTEIKITEKQYAIGVQPMLYFCFPITELKSANPIIGRTAETKETADLIIDSSNIDIFLKMLKIFGVLSPSHNQDTLTIIDKIIE
ncbi:MAG: R.Pab1 family restriction endonuclease [Rickettsiales bacterium]|jgi:hypothetical protein|nr:R.Pab1 family restriction endonuclease [Rickettsiales bacterium]